MFAVISETCFIRKLTKVTGANGHQDLGVVAGSAGICKDNKGRKKEREESQLVTLHNTLLKHLYANIYTEPLEIKGRLSKSHAQECEM